MNTAILTEPWRQELRALWKVAGPLVVNFLAVAGMNFADAVMAGRLGPRQLAAVAVGGSVWIISLIICLGLLMSLSPIIARHYGAGRLDLIGRYTRQGVWIALALSLTLFLLVEAFVQPVLAAIGIDEAFRDLTGGYVKAIYFGLPAIAVFFVLRFTNEGIGVTRPIMYTSLFSLVANVFLNYVLMFGKFGFPALGVVGCGIASAITMWLMTIGLAIYVFRHPRYVPMRIFSKVAPIRLSIFSEVLSLGWPIMISLVAEVGLFAALSLLMGTLGVTIAAAHQIAMNFASTMFMVPLALSSAITVRIGHELGKGDAAAARFAGKVGITFCGLFMACAAIVMLSFRDAVVQIYTNDIDVQAIAVTLLLMAALFQVADGVQIGAAGALRGYKDTRVPMVINTIAYWLVGFPIAFLAAKVYFLEPKFIWSGLVLGLIVSAFLLTLRFRKISKIIG
jgi:MATE family multidrug resistance protein